MSRFQKTCTKIKQRSHYYQEVGLPMENGLQARSHAAGYCDLFFSQNRK